MLTSSLLPVLLSSLLSPCEGITWRIGTQSSIGRRIGTNPRFSNFTFLLEQTDLLDDLICVWSFWCQKYTIFAPVDEAFAETSLGELIANPDDLNLFLRNHILKGSLSANSFQDGTEVTMLGGQSVQFTADADGSMLLNAAAKFLSSDIDANNGVVIMVDRVLFMPALTTPDSMWSTLVKTLDLSTFTAAIEMIGFKSYLESSVDVTLFAPSNSVFEQLSESAYENFFDDPEALAEILMYHVLPKSVALDDLEVSTLTTQQGEDVTVEFNYSWLFVLSGVTLNGVTHIDFSLKNIRGDDPGTIFIIDSLLIPQTYRAYTAARTANATNLN